MTEYEETFEERLNAIYCDLDNRKKCDSLYIERNNELETRIKESIKLLEQYYPCLDKEQIEEIYIVLKGKEHWFEDLENE